MSHDYADPQFIAEPAIAALINGIPSQSRLLCYIAYASDDSPRLEAKAFRRYEGKILLF